MPEFTLLIVLHSYFGLSWQLDVRGDALYWVKTLDGNVVEEKNKTLNAEEIESFIMEVEKMGALDWEAHYLHCCMLDGATWSVDLQVDSRRIQSRGTNGYPESWVQFCNAFSRLTGVDENPCKIML